MATGLCGDLGQSAVDHVPRGDLDHDRVPAQARPLRLVGKTVQETPK